VIYLFPFSVLTAAGDCIRVLL